MKIEELDVLQRWRKTAETWFGKATRRLERAAGKETTAGTAWLVGYEAERLLITALDNAYTLADLLNDDASEEAYELSKKLTHRLRGRRLSQKLGNVEGRTAEETAAFESKAKELSSR